MQSMTPLKPACIPCSQNEGVVPLFQADRLVDFGFRREEAIDIGALHPLWPSSKAPSCSCEGSLHGRCRSGLARGGAGRLSARVPPGGGGGGGGGGWRG